MELALVLPILMLIVLGIVDFGRVFVSASALTHGTREAVRYATVSGSGTSNPGNIRQQVIAEGTRAGTTVTASQISIDYFTINATECAGAPTAPCSIGIADNGAAYTAASPCPRVDCSTPLVGDLVQVKVSVPWSATTVMINRLLPAGFAVNANSSGTIE